MNIPRGSIRSNKDITAMIESIVITIPLVNGGYSFYHQHRVFSVGELFTGGLAIYEVTEVAEDGHSGIARYVSSDVEAAK